MGASGLKVDLFSGIFLIVIDIHPRLWFLVHPSKQKGCYWVPLETQTLLSLWSLRYYIVLQVRSTAFLFLPIPQFNAPSQYSWTSPNRWFRASSRSGRSPCTRFGSYPANLGNPGVSLRNRSSSVGKSSFGLGESGTCIITLFKDRTYRPKIYLTMGCWNHRRECKPDGPSCYRTRSGPYSWGWCRDQCRSSEEVFPQVERTSQKGRRMGVSTFTVKFQTWYWRLREAFLLLCNMRSSIYQMLSGFLMLC